MNIPATRQFITSYIKSMRLYYTFVTGIAGWVGVSFYNFKSPDDISAARSVLVLVLLFLSWGINQIVNDYLGMKEDRINAPNRPMVNGELNIRAAMIVTSILLVLMLVITWFLNPWALIPAIGGILLNVVYEYAKAFSLLANIVFGVMISMCTVYGFLAAGPLLDPVFTTNRFTVVAMVAILNGLMTYYTYFKDYRGDKRAGKETFIVKYGLNVGRYVGVVGAFVSAIALLFFIMIDWLPTNTILYMEEFIFCCMVTLFLQCWTAYLFFSNPVGKKTYYSLAINIRACVAGQIALIAIFNGTLALYLLVISYILIGLFFDQHSDARA
jgi:geranylgeranylglycerol-phosphate geranylgeranyltransferase